MKLFEFLSKVAQQSFPYNLVYREGIGCIDVEVNAFSERWVISFDEDGITDIEVFHSKSCQSSGSCVQLEELFDRPIKSWQQAAFDLEISFISPFKFNGPNGEELEVTGLLPDFGAQKGVIITSRLDSEEAWHEAMKLEGYFHTGLNPLYYDRYNKESFIETLKDWGWSSSSPKPKWL